MQLLGTPPVFGQEEGGARDVLAGGETQEAGEMLTKLLLFSGPSVEINYSTSAAGVVRVEIQDIDGSPVPGFELDECLDIIGDGIERTVSWKNGADVSALAGRPIRLRFVTKDADLSALRFA